MERKFVHNLTHAQLIEIFDEYKEWDKSGTLKENTLLRKITEAVYGRNATILNLNQISVDVAEDLAELYVQSIKSRFNVQELYKDYQGE
jgi:hypothetical protein